MASGPFILGNSDSERHNFCSDDVFCPYDDFTNEDSSSVTHVDSSKDFHVSRMMKTPTFPATVINTPEGFFSQDVIAKTVEKSMKTCTDNLMRFLEGISSRLSQLELYCYNLDKSIGEMRSELTSDHEEVDSKLKSLDKHLQEVHRSVQILRDKQEIVETQKDLAKLQLARKGSPSSNHSQSNEEKLSSSDVDPKRTDNAHVTSSEPQNLQLALALSHQQPMAFSSKAPSSNVTQTTQQPHYYMLPPPSPNLSAAAQLPQNQYSPSDSQYRYHPSTSSQVTQNPTAQQFSQFQQQQPQQQQQQWPQQLPQQVQPQQPPSTHSHTRPPSVNAYTPYHTSQATSPSPTATDNTFPNSMPMQNPYPGIPPQIKGHSPAQPGNPYGSSEVHTAPPPASAYAMNRSEGGQASYPTQPSQFAQSVYPPQSAPLQNPAPHNPTIRNPSQRQLIRSHPYNELIDNLVNMGVRGDLVVSIIQRMEETGQPVNFNSVLDRLNAHSSLGPQRGW
ncbi:unnamed protein product [Vicia faba]|uniref:DUF1421 domain-containing protein n=1 Tax=Vicia faba TaxID=3906 RepID=A0AAV0Z259_VICFA|nr:unnamed protein product [Vicia faba]